MLAGVGSDDPREEVLEVDVLVLLLEFLRFPNMRNIFDSVLIFFWNVLDSIENINRTKKCSKKGC